MINLTVGDLRDCIKNLPDDMDVIIPVSCAEDANYILERIKPIVGQSGNITECRVDCQTGNIIIGLNC